MLSCLLCFLASAYPRLALVFMFLISLDFSSHYIHMYASVASGSTSHKKVTKEQSWILWSYYNNSVRAFLPSLSSHGRRARTLTLCPPSALAENPLHLLRRQRALLRRPLRPQLVLGPAPLVAPLVLLALPRAPSRARPQGPPARLVAPPRRHPVRPDLRRQADHQRRPVRQGGQAARAQRPGGALRRAAEEGLSVSAQGSSRRCGARVGRASRARSGRDGAGAQGRRRSGERSARTSSSRFEGRRSRERTMRRYRKCGSGGARAD